MLRKTVEGGPMLQEPREPKRSLQKSSGVFMVIRLLGPLFEYRTRSKGI